MLTMKDVIREGHPSLETRSNDIRIPLDDETKQMLKEMREFLINSQDDTLNEKYDLRPGVGLAAPQINILKRALAIYTTDETGEIFHDYLMVNPKILSHSVKETYLPGGEGCLSIDRDVEGVVPRYHKVTVKTHLYDVKTDTLSEKTLNFKGYISIVFLHELDHLNGILFPKRIVSDAPGAIPIKFTINETQEER